MKVYLSSIRKAVSLNERWSIKEKILNRNSDGSKSVEAWFTNGSGVWFHFSNRVNKDGTEDFPALFEGRHSVNTGEVTRTLDIMRRAQNMIIKALT